MDRIVLLDEGSFCEFENFNVVRIPVSCINIQRVTFIHVVYDSNNEEAASLFVFISEMKIPNIANMYPEYISALWLS